MRIAELARSPEALENTSGRLRTYGLLGELFAAADEDEIAPTAYLTEGHLLPD